PIIGQRFTKEPFFSRENVDGISHRLWRERLDSDPSIVGKSITLNGPLFTVVGVMPPGFQYPNDTDVWHRLQWDLTQHSRGAHFMESIVRLKPGGTIDMANAELRALTQRLGKENPSTNGDWSARATPLAAEVVGFFRPALFALFGAAAFLLVITCTNVASLLLTRATVREREVAVRAAIGANRTRLVRQFLTESVLLAILGTGLGVVLATASVRTLLAISPVQLPRLDAAGMSATMSGLGIDARVLMFAAALAAATALAFGVVPALLMAGSDIQRPLQESGRGGDGSGGRRHLRSVLVAAETGLAVMLLAGTTLLARSFEHLVRQDPGFRPERVMTVHLELPFRYGDFKKIADFYNQLLTSLRAQPGIDGAGLANFLPLDAAWRMPFRIDGRPIPAAADAPQAQQQSIDEQYFKVIGVPLIKGRFFDAHDTTDTAGVVIINEALARREWGNGDPIGQRISIGVRYIGPMGTVLKPPDTKDQIVGVVANVRNASLVQAPEPAIYFTYRQFSFRGFNIVVHGHGDSAALIGPVRDQVKRLDPNLPMSQARALDRIIADATDRPRALM